MQKHKIKGISLVEVILAMAILIFALVTTTKIITSNIIKSDLLISRVDLFRDLDQRIGNYAVSNMDNDLLPITENIELETSSGSVNYRSYNFVARDDNKDLTDRQIYIERSIIISSGSGSTT